MYVVLQVFPIYISYILKLDLVNIKEGIVLVFLVARVLKQWYKQIYYVSPIKRRAMNN